VIMKQLQQSLRTGSTDLVEVPVPRCGKGEVLIKSRVSLISAGTERMLLKFGKSGFFGKARQQPDKIKQVISKAKTDGLYKTFEAVNLKLNSSIPMGYSNVGVVDEVGADVFGYSIGDRVVSNGHHAEMIISTPNLMALIPDSVSDEAASFTVVGAIALHAVRLADITIGERVAVVGLGLVGLMAIQILRAHGCQVIGFDYDEQKLELARDFGASVVNLSNHATGVEQAMSFSEGLGVDAVFVATSTNENAPIRNAAAMSRQRGRIILVGTAGLNFSRDDFYKKELKFQVSCSYGPGRYDVNYEAGGQDYPYAYVRWTEQRNFTAVLQLMADGKIDVSNLITSRIEFENAASAYRLLMDTKSSQIGVLFNYSTAIKKSKVESNIHLPPALSTQKSSPTISFIGAGNYAFGVLIPAFKSSGASLYSIASKNGLSASNAARKFAFSQATTDISALIKDPIDAIVVSTRHNSHARFVCEALAAGKNVFVEKPLCLNLHELTQIEKFLKTKKTRPLLMVGFNRRFSPLIQKMKSLLDVVKEPKVMIYTVNAGAVPEDHWTQDPNIGGGRIVGEACHFIDVLRFLADSKIEKITSSFLPGGAKDVATINIDFFDGSIAAIHYLANGHRAVSKERLEVFVGGKVLQLDNFRKLRGYGWKNFSTKYSWVQDKGQRACVKAFLMALKGECGEPIPIEQILEVSRQTLQASQRVK
jgi:predicted dehydrogenase